MIEFFIFFPTIIAFFIFGLFLYSEYGLSTALLPAGVALTLLVWWAATPIPNDTYFYDVYEIKNRLFIESRKHYDSNNGFHEVTHLFERNVNPKDYCVKITYHRLRSSNGIYFIRDAEETIVSKKQLGQSECWKIKSIHD